jgi:hypothetical protein
MAHGFDTNRVQESANPHASRNGVIEHVRTDYRRLGYGRLLVAAARTLGTGYRWTTTTILPTLDVRSH